MTVTVTQTTKRRRTSNTSSGTDTPLSLVVQSNCAEIQHLLDHEVLELERQLCCIRDAYEQTSPLVREVSLRFSEFIEAVTTSIAQQDHCIGRALRNAELGGAERSATLLREAVCLAYMQQNLIARRLDAFRRCLTSSAPFWPKNRATIDALQAIARLDRYISRELHQFRWRILPKIAKFCTPEVVN
jgi:hypothetical protein